MKPVEGKDFLYIPSVPLHLSANPHYGSGSYGSLIMTKELFAAIPFKLKDPQLAGRERWLLIDGHTPVEWTKMFLEQGSFDLQILNNFIRKIVKKVPHSRLLKVSEQIRLKIHQGWFSHSIRFKTPHWQLEKYQIFPIEKRYSSHCKSFFRSLPNYEG